MSGANISRRSHSSKESLFAAPTMSQERVRLIQDPQHGAMQVLPCQMQLLQTQHFQRLYNLKQLGCAFHVYPGATHTRAEHSLGVAWLTRVLIRCIRTHQPEVEIDQRDEMLLVLAAQAHDLGHGAGSHAYEGWLHSLDDSFKSWRHEQQSVRILRDAVSKGLLPCLADDASGVDRIEAFIVGKQPSQVRTSTLPKNKRWMLDIVSNSRNGIDVDKLDYLGRDSHHALGGVETGLLNVRRILENVRVSTDRQRLCFHAKMVDTLYEVFHRRWSMFRAVYLHNTSVAIELMLRKAMTHLLRARNFPLLRMIVFGNKIDDYLLLDDSLMSTALATERMLNESERSTDWQLRLACDIVRAIGERRVYRCVSRKTVATSRWTKLCASNTNALDCKRWLPPAYRSEAEKFVVHSCRFHYGGGERNPLEHVYFFDWRNPNECKKMQTREYTRMLPRHWSEVVLRVFSTSPCSSQQVAEIDRAFTQYVSSLMGESDSGGGSGGRAGDQDYDDDNDNLESSKRRLDDKRETRQREAAAHHSKRRRKK